MLHVLEAVQFGTVRHLQGVVRHVDADHIVAIRPEGAGRFTDHEAIRQMRDDGAQIEFVAMRRNPPDPRNASAILRVRTLIRREAPDAVHGHSSIGGAVARLAALGTGVAAVYTPNGLLQSRAAMSLERVLGRFTSKIVASSRSEAALIARERLARADQIVVIPNAIELAPPPPIDLRDRLGLDPSVPLVGNVGRLAAQKAPEIYVRACAEVASSHPAAHFVLIGDGDLQDLVGREITRTGLEDRFHVIQMPSGADATMPSFDVYAMPSRYEAGNPFSAMEAMRAGVPVVLTDVVGNCDAVQDGVTGLLVPPDDPGALAAAVRRLLDDPGLRRELGENGRRRVKEHYDVRVVGGRLEAMYRSAATGRGEP